MMKPPSIRKRDRRSSKAALLGGFVAFTTALLGACDTVKLTNTSTSENGLLIDARTLSGPDNDKGFVSGKSSINVGINRQRSGTNEVVAFSNRRPVALRQVKNWKFGSVTVPSTMLARSPFRSRYGSSGGHSASKYKRRSMLPSRRL